MEPNILIIDDEKVMLDAYKCFLEFHHANIHWSETGQDGIAKYKSDPTQFDVVIVDYFLPDIMGDEVARMIHRINPHQEIVFATGDNTTGVLTALLQAGVAKGFFYKGTEPERIKKSILESIERFQTRIRILDESEEASDSHIETELKKYGLTGKSKAMFEVAKKIKRYQKTSGSVLILGETGVGKEKIALALNGCTADGLFVINCAKYKTNDHLLESELFGYMKGSFTGADKDKMGLLEAANGKTVFFDEIHCLSLPAQEKLLRVFQEKKVRRLGNNSDREISTNFRIIAATKPDINDRIKNGTFLPDLYYRISTLGIKIPKLMERIEDIEPLAIYFCKKYSEQNGVNKHFRSATIREMETHKWPGNVRELEHCVERLVVDSKDSTIEEEDFQEYLDSLKDHEMDSEHSKIKTFKEFQFEDEKAYLIEVLSNSESISEAARLAELPKSTFADKLKKLDIEPCEYLRVSKEKR